jgi:hypothetical protein
MHLCAIDAAAKDVSSNEANRRPIGSPSSRST